MKFIDAVNSCYETFNKETASPSEAFLDEVHKTLL